MILHECSKRRGIFLFFILLLICCLNLQASADKEDSKPVLFCYSNDCYACIEMKDFIESLIAQNPELDIEMCDIYENADRWNSACNDAGIPSWGVPRIFIGDKVFADFYEQDGKLSYFPSYYGYVGFRNQILIALEEYTGLSLSATEFMETSSFSSIECNSGCV